MMQKDASKLLLSVLVSESAGLIGSIFTVSSNPAWYAALAKPALNPPSWLFAPVWTALYLMMGIAAFLVWRGSSPVSAKNEAGRIRGALAIFTLQLVLNTLWSVIFFGLHNIFGALIEIVLLWFAILWTVIAFHRISRPAAYLLVPYLLWVSFATYLNASLWMLKI